MSNNCKEVVARLRNAQGYRMRAEAICVKDISEEQVLVISSRRKGGKWTMPGGGIEPGEEAEHAAIREVEEEAGVKGKITRCLGTFQNEMSQSVTTVFVLVVDEELDEWEEKERVQRVRKWMKVEEVCKLPNLQNTYRIECLKKLKSYRT